jgi:hypothetical protein
MRRTLVRAGVGGFACVCVALGATAARAQAIDLIGTWYVLAHYKDSATNNPDFERWQDRIWVFEPSGSRLKWIEYPIVVFDDESGRFERLGGNRQARVMDFWEPSPSQLAQIEGGLEVNPRGSKTKTLRGSTGEGWHSRGPITAMSANTLTYTEIWRVEDLGGLPIFRFEESLGGARSETLEGVTEYQTTEVVSDSELRGTFNRDGTRTGTFRLMRVGGVSDVKGSGKDNNQRVMAMFASQVGGSEELAAVFAGGGDAKPADLPDEVKDEVRAEVRKMVEDAMKQQSIDPRRFSAEVTDMTNQVMAEWERGKTPEQIARMIREGKIAPRTMSPMR